jgi:hypothetical protein
LGLLELIMPLLYIFAALVLFIALFSIGWYSRLRRIRFDRKGKGVTREQFLEIFRRMGIPEVIPVAVYDYNRSQKSWEDFPFLPDDEYSKVLHNDPDELDEDALALVKCLGMAMLPEDILQQRGDKPIKTLRDMVIWLDWVRQHQPVKQTGNPSVQRL